MKTALKVLLVGLVTVIVLLATPGMSFGQDYIPHEAPPTWTNPTYLTGFHREPYTYTPPPPVVYQREPIDLENQAIIRWSEDFTRTLNRMNRTESQKFNECRERSPSSWEEQKCSTRYLRDTSGTTLIENHKLCDKYRTGSWEYRDCALGHARQNLANLEAM